MSWRAGSTAARLVIPADPLSLAVGGKKDKVTRTTRWSWSPEAIWTAEVKAACAGDPSEAAQGPLPQRSSP
jgi:hypothetical protein